MLDEIGAGERSRTPDKLITSQLLYQLSYTGAVKLPQTRRLLYSSDPNCANYSQLTC